MPSKEFMVLPWSSKLKMRNWDSGSGLIMSSGVWWKQVLSGEMVPQPRSPRNSLDLGWSTWLELPLFLLKLSGTSWSIKWSCCAKEFLRLLPTRVFHLANVACATNLRLLQLISVISQVTRKHYLNFPISLVFLQWHKECWCLIH